MSETWTRSSSTWKRCVSNAFHRWNNISILAYLNLRSNETIRCSETAHICAKKMMIFAFHSIFTRTINNYNYRTRNNNFFAAKIELLHNGFRRIYKKHIACAYRPIMQFEIIIKKTYFVLLVFCLQHCECVSCDWKSKFSAISCYCYLFFRIEEAKKNL